MRLGNKQLIQTNEESHSNKLHNSKNNYLQLLADKTRFRFRTTSITKYELNFHSNQVVAL